MTISKSWKFKKVIGSHYFRRKKNLTEFVVTKILKRQKQTFVKNCKFICTAQSKKKLSRFSGKMS